MAYKLSGRDINTLKVSKLKRDGHGLYWHRWADGTLAAYTKYEGKSYKIDEFVGAITKIQIDEIRLKHGENKLNLKRKKQHDKSLQINTETKLNEFGSLSGKSPFSKVWEAWLSRLDNIVESGRTPTWKESTRRKNESRVKNHIQPTILYGKAVNAITPNDIAGIFTHTSRDTTDKVKGIIKTVLDFAMAQELVKNNAAEGAGSLINVGQKRGKKKKLPALTDIPSLQKLLLDIEQSSLSYQVRMALRLQAFTALRTNEVVQLTWEMVDFENAVLVCPREIMKYKDRDFDHRIPLTDTTVDLLKNLRRTKSRFLFPSPTSIDMHISTEGLSKSMRNTLNYRDKHVPHGWRSALETRAQDAMTEDERPLFNPHWIDFCLDHEVKGTVKKSYLREQTQNGMRAVFNWWDKSLKEST